MHVFKNTFDKRSPVELWNISLVPIQQVVSIIFCTNSPLSDSLPIRQESNLLPMLDLVVPLHPRSTWTTKFDSKPVYKSNVNECEIMVQEPGLFRFEKSFPLHSWDPSCSSLYSWMRWTWTWIPCTRQQSFCCCNTVCWRTSSVGQPLLKITRSLNIVFDWKVSKIHLRWETVWSGLVDSMLKTSRRLDSMSKEPTWWVC